jgi:hypothetical protein
VAAAAGTVGSAVALMGFGLQALNRRPPARVPKLIADRRRKSRRLRGECFLSILFAFYLPFWVRNRIYQE